MSAGIDCTAEVLSIGQRSGMFNVDPMLPVELLVIQPGQPPRPASMTLVVPLAHLGQLSVGATLPVRVGVSNPAAVWVNWAAIA